MNKVIAIHQPNFLPWAGYFKKVLLSDTFVVLDDAQFSKQSYTQRTKIKTNNDNSIWLRVPVIKKFHFRPIRDVRINNQLNWRLEHLIAFENSYSKCPYYKEIISIIKPIYERNWELLMEFNVELLKACLKILRVKFNLKLSSELGVTESASNRIVEICKKLNARVYLSGLGAKEYNLEDDFEKNQIQIEYLKTAKQEYAQMGKRFIQGLSILDLLFNEGSQGSLEYLKESY